MGINHGGPTLIARGNDEQKAFHLPRILRGDDVWCQGFSEPDAGSDLASIKTRAVIDGDELVVTGQKIWTSFAHMPTTRSCWCAPTPTRLDTRADVGDLRHARTRHRRRDRSRRSIAAPSSARCSTTRCASRIDNVVGDIGDGWSVAMSTLSLERGTGFMAEIIDTTQTIDQLIDEARHRLGPDGRRPLLADDEYARRLAALKAEITVLRSMAYRAISRNRRDGTPGPEGSMLRLAYGNLLQSMTRLAMDMLGHDALAYVDRFRPGGWTGLWLRSFAAGIGGGTFEIQRNIIGERMLGLPRDRS